MISVHDGSVVLEFVAVLNVIVVAGIVSAADERAVHADGWRKIERRSAVFFAYEPKANFVDGLRVHDLCVGELNLMFGGEIVHGLRCRLNRPMPLPVSFSRSYW